MATARTSTIRRFTAAEMEAIVAAGIVAVSEREAVAAGRRFTVDEYLALGAAGILAKEERIELLDGEIICMAPIGNRHMNSVDWVARLMHPAIGDRAMVRVQGSIQLDDASMPEPDIAVIRLRSVNDLAPVLPSDVYLLVEVADSSLEFDLGREVGPIRRRRDTGSLDCQPARRGVGGQHRAGRVGLHQRPRYPIGWQREPASVSGRGSRVGRLHSCRRLN